MRYELTTGDVVHALERVSLEIQTGELVSILGPSGCGKTTLLNILAGFLAPSEGQVSVNGRRVTGPGPDRGMVFQQGALFEWLSVEGNVAFGPRMMGKPKRETDEKVRHLLDVVGLAGFASKPVYQLSGGMQQRVALSLIHI